MTPLLAKPEPSVNTTELRAARTKSLRRPSMNFPSALEIVLQFEGGYVDDRGGPTNHGITQRVYDAYRQSQDLRRRSVRTIADVELQAIYHDYYWMEVRADDLPSQWPLLAFDFAVNAGPDISIKVMQAAVGADVDGSIGPQTLNALDAASSLGPHRALDIRLGYYIALRDPRNFRGWQNRVDKLRTFLN